MSEKILFHRYVRIEDVPAYLALGWKWDRKSLHAPLDFILS